MVEDELTPVPGSDDPLPSYEMSTDEQGVMFIDAEKYKARISQAPLSVGSSGLKPISIETIDESPIPLVLPLDGNADMKTEPADQLPPVPLPKPPPKPSVRWSRWLATGVGLILVTGAIYLAVVR